MTSSTRSFRELVKQAHDGRLKLPAFQRKWRWKSEKVIKLYDSLRQKYPIGALLFLKGEQALLAPRTFEGAHVDASNSPADFLVLDGQQRLTAGIHLYHSTGPKQYYVNLDILEKLVTDQNIDLNDRSQAEQFVASLDAGDGYLVARKAVADPRSLLVRKNLLCTSILADSMDLGVALNDYVRAYPARSDLVVRLVQPYFALTGSDSIPVIEIEENTRIEAISNIFMTLNTTGQLLTPFELVVSILFPQNIDLSQEVTDFRDKGTFFPNMDKTGEVLLQTIALLAEKSPKKASLPITISGPIYQQNKQQAFEALEKLGDFVTRKLGAGLNIPGVDMVPYDAAYAPMALALRAITERRLRGNAQTKAESKLSKWYVGAALSNRYQEGVHNKQTKDLKEFLVWLNDDTQEPPWLTDVVIPRLLRASTDGAIGKLLRGLLNRNNPRDPSSSHHIGFHPGAYLTEKHHIFPIKYLPTIQGWNAGDSGDVVLNLMFLEGDTNKRWINGNPVDHVSEALRNQGDTAVVHAYRAQFIEETALSILKKPTKVKADFDEFLVLRESAFQNAIASEFGLPVTAAGSQDEDEEQESS